MLYNKFLHSLTVGGHTSVFGARSTSIGVGAGVHLLQCIRNVRTGAQRWNEALPQQFELELYCILGVLGGHIRSGDPYGAFRHSLTPRPQRHRHFRRPDAIIHILWTQSIPPLLRGDAVGN